MVNQSEINRLPASCMRGAPYPVNQQGIMSNKEEELREKQQLYYRDNSKQQQVKLFL